MELKNTHKGDHFACLKSYYDFFEDKEQIYRKPGHTTKYGIVPENNEQMITLG